MYKDLYLSPAYTPLIPPNRNTWSFSAVIIRLHFVAFVNRGYATIFLEGTPQQKTPDSGCAVSLQVTWRASPSSKAQQPTVDYKVPENDF